MTVAFPPPVAPQAPPRPARRPPDALAARQVDELVSKLLSEVQVPFDSMGKRVLNHLADLKKILSTDYLEDIALPPKPLLHELAQVVDSEITTHDGRWKTLDSPEVLSRLFRRFGPREIELRAEPYTEGAGLALRGFFCRTTIGQSAKFVIFVNTAHHPGAAAATLGHELGHYIYGSLKGEKASLVAFMEGTFSKHFHEEDELFADSLVALAAYSREMFKEIQGPVPGSKAPAPHELLTRIRGAYRMIGPRYSLDLSRLSAAWRVRYLASMTHFFKLRWALQHSAGL
ncbi:MAG TPA: ImmA/IrrE family metallo-endopeptidase [Candidatus Binataceae bacterium]|nr:ImmA/IrrE family metallo-endopeptidase [Candidatus Binataceae bacterium]